MTPWQQYGWEALTQRPEIRQQLRPQFFVS
jgi:hypothetical protein